MREFGALLARHGFLATGEDVFLLRHDEVRSALEELRPLELGRRGRRARPVPLAGHRRAAKADPRGDARMGAAARSRPDRPKRSPSRSTIMHWGITTERIQEWLVVRERPREHA